MAREGEKETIWVVVRLDLFQGDLDALDPGKTITLREAVPTQEDAEAEAQRLQALKDERRVTYFAAPVSWYPNGRDVQAGY